MFHLLAQLISFQMEAEELGEERETFLSVLGHDLRNPLHAIHFSAHVLLARDGLPPELQSPVERILRSVDRIESMVGDLLDFARGRFGGGLSLDRREVDVGRLVRRVVDELAAGHPRRTIEVELDGTPRARWDPDRVAQALSNLVSNALAYSPEETPVTVGVTNAAERLRLEVHNRGEPIPPEVQARIFQPFSRGRDDTAGSGLGLGLYIAAQVAHAHDGEIAVSSSAEMGTTFSLVLPA